MVVLIRAYFLPVGLLSCALTALVTASLLFGRTLPEPPLVQLWHLTDCAPPCWLGITPGETTVEEANASLAETLRLPANYPKPEEILDGLAAYELPLPDYHEAMMTVAADVVSRDNGVVTAILVFSGRKENGDIFMPSLGDIVTTYGLPTCVVPGSSTIEDWTLFYDTAYGATQVTIAGGDSLSWTQPISYLIFAKHSSESEDEICFSDPTWYYHPWRGLHRARYQRNVSPRWICVDC